MGFYANHLKFVELCGDFSTLSFLATFQSSLDTFQFLDSILSAVELRFQVANLTDVLQLGRF